MHIRHLILAALCAGPFTLMAQWCANDDIRAYYTLTDPRFEDRMERYERWIDEAMGYTSGSKRETRTIEVVFHVVYREEEQNIPESQVLSVLDALNRDFQGYAWQKNVPGTFRDLVTYMDLRFCPVIENGRPLIIRRETTVDEIGNRMDGDGRLVVHYDSRGGSTPLDPDRYLNIWVADMSTGFLGRAALPGMAAFPEEDGVVLDFRAAGYIDRAASIPFDLGHTVTHEVGHYLGLYHPWGPGGPGDCGTDDQVEDTPLQSVIYRDCPEENQLSCGSEDAIFNFMQIQEDRCLQFFTAGQVQRMNATLAGPRAGIVQSGVCTAPTPDGNLEDFFTIRHELGLGRLDIFIHGELPFSYEYELYDMHGRLLTKGDMQARYNNIIFSSSYPASIYFLRISGNGHSFTRKLVLSIK